MNQLRLVHPVRTSHLLRAARPRRVFNRLGEHLAAWWAQRRTRAALLSLSDDELKDAGISRAQALYEFDRSSWRA
jgi:uncharacterized protein YjiS (DUF1127 family)